MSIEATVQATTDTVQDILHRLQAEMHDKKIDTDFLGSSGALALGPLRDGKDDDAASSSSIWLTTPKAMAQKAIVDKLCQTKFGQRNVPVCATTTTTTRAAAADSNSTLQNSK
jgi:hypothetical protein